MGIEEVEIFQSERLSPKLQLTIDACSIETKDKQMLKDGRVFYTLDFFRRKKGAVKKSQMIDSKRSIE